MRPLAAYLRRSPYGEQRLFPDAMALWRDPKDGRELLFVESVASGELVCIDAETGAYLRTIDDNVWGNCGVAVDRVRSVLVYANASCVREYHLLDNLWRSRLELNGESFCRGILPATIVRPSATATTDDAKLMPRYIVCDSGKKQVLQVEHGSNLVLAGCGDGDEHVNETWKAAPCTDDAASSGSAEQQRQQCVRQSCRIMDGPARSIDLDRLRHLCADPYNAASFGVLYVTVGPELLPVGHPAYVPPSAGVTPPAGSYFGYVLKIDLHSRTLAPLYTRLFFVDVTQRPGCCLLMFDVDGQIGGVGAAS
jgi:hypothetical protein